MVLNGSLAGLVGITAGADVVSVMSAIIIGLIAGCLVVVSVIFIDSKLRIDDPVGAVSVHGIAGVWGLLSIGLFADGTYGNYSIEAPYITGLFYGGGFDQLLAQLSV